MRDDRRASRIRDSLVTFLVVERLPHIGSTSTTVGTQCAVSYYKGKDANGKPLVRTTPLVLDVGSRSVAATFGTQRRRLR